MVDENGKQTITNDGATVMKVRRYSKTLDISRYIRHAAWHNKPIC